jgi:hypothetical protein
MLYILFVCMPGTGVLGTIKASYERVSLMSFAFRPIRINTPHDALRTLTNLLFVHVAEGSVGTS